MNNKRAERFIMAGGLLIAGILSVAILLKKTVFNPINEVYTIWLSGEISDVTTYHQFGLLVTDNGTILATCEARVTGKDAGVPHHIVLKRSEDNGKTWGDTVFIADYSENVCSYDENDADGIVGHCYANPTMLQDSSTGRIFIFYSENFNNNLTKTYYRVSDDEGVSWSEQIEVSDLFDEDPYNREFHLPGPGHGIQILNGDYVGRLILEVWHRHGISLDTDEREYGISFIYSDDGGNTWESSNYLPVGYDIGEGRIAELKDGVLVLNARVTSDNVRMNSFSYDGGVSWSEPAVWESIGEYASCDSGFISNIRHSKVTLLTSHLALGTETGIENRNNLYIYLSENYGNTWEYCRRIWSDDTIESGTGASDLTVITNKTYGVIYGDSFYDNNVIFEIFNDKWIKES